MQGRRGSMISAVATPAPSQIQASMTGNAVGNIPVFMDRVLLVFFPAFCDLRENGWPLLISSLHLARTWLARTALKSLLQDTFTSAYNFRPLLNQKWMLGNTRLSEKNDDKLQWWDGAATARQAKTWAIHQHDVIIARRKCSKFACGALLHPVYLF